MRGGVGRFLFAQRYAIMGDYMANSHQMGELTMLDRIRRLGRFLVGLICEAADTFPPLRTPQHPKPPEPPKLDRETDAYLQTLFDTPRIESERVGRIVDLIMEHEADRLRLHRIIKAQREEKRQLLAQLREAGL